MSLVDGQHLCVGKFSVNRYCTMCPSYEYRPKKDLFLNEAKNNGTFFKKCSSGKEAEFVSIEILKKEGYNLKNIL